jgi:hypothetical protein
MRVSRAHGHFVFIPVTFAQLTSAAEIDVGTSWRFLWQEGLLDAGD